MYPGRAVFRTVGCSCVSCKFGCQQEPILCWENQNYTASRNTSECSGIWRYQGNSSIHGHCLSHTELPTIGVTLKRRARGARGKRRLRFAAQILSIRASKTGIDLESDFFIVKCVFIVLLRRPFLDRVQYYMNIYSRLWKAIFVHETFRSRSHNKTRL